MDMDRGVPPQPDDYKTLLESNAEIYMWSGSDHEYGLREKLDLEWHHVPYLNQRLAEDVEGEQDISQRMTLVYIIGFFTDGCDFIYYVKGGANMSRFMAGTFSGKPYDSPCFATPCTVFNAQELFNSAGLDSIQFGRVDKKETKGLRWKYLYESAVKAWEKLEFDYDKLQGIKTKIDPERQCLSSSYAEEGDLESPAGEEHVEVPASERQSPSTNPTTPASGEPEAQGNGDKGDMEQYDERIEESDVEMDTPEGDDEEDGAQRDILEGEDDEGDAPMDISWGESA